MEKKAQEKRKQRKRSFFEVKEKRVSQKFKKIFSHKEFDMKKHREEKDKKTEV